MEPLCLAERPSEKQPLADDAVVISLVQADPATYLIRLNGDRSHSYRRALHRAVLRAVRHGGRRIVVDCASWSQLDLIVLSALLGCAAACAAHDARFELSGVGPDLRQRIEALSLANRLGIAAAASDGANLPS
jgi:anti-anti-sigma regulatory factor